MDVSIIKEGWHHLEGFCEYTGPNEYNNEVSGVIIRLDGKNYFVYEDPDDGYRSYGEIVETDEPCTNTFPPQRVMVRTYDDHGEYQSDCGIIIASPDFKPILKIGTDNYEDYYPMAVYDWHPENLPINQKFRDVKYKMPMETIMKINEYLSLSNRDDLEDIFKMLDDTYRKCYNRAISDIVYKLEDIMEDLDEYSYLSEYVSVCESIKTMIGELKKD